MDRKKKLCLLKKEKYMFCDVVCAKVEGENSFCRTFDNPEKTRDLYIGKYLPEIIHVHENDKFTKSIFEDCYKQKNNIDFIRCVHDQEYEDRNIILQRFYCWAQSNGAISNLGNIYIKNDCGDDEKNIVKFMDLIPFYIEKNYGNFTEVSAIKSLKGEKFYDSKYISFKEPLFIPIVPIMIVIYLLILCCFRRKGILRYLKSFLRKIGEYLTNIASSVKEDSEELLEVTFED